MTLDELARLQAAFGARIAAGGDGPGAMAPWLGSDPARVERLARYGQALRRHQARSLAQVFPVLHALLGAEVFLALAQAYGDACPSVDPDLARFGERLPGFLLTWQDSACRPWFADLARLEWLLHQSHGAPNAAPLSLHEVQRAGARLDAWRLRLHPAAVPYRSQWRTVALWLGQGEAASRAGSTLALVYRSGWHARVRETDAAEWRALSILAEGATLGEALAAAQAESAAGIDPGALFTRWLADGLLVRER